MDRDTLQGYACWAVAAALGIVVTVIVIASVLHWTVG
jgi:hypothetical protein